MQLYRASWTRPKFKRQNCEGDHLDFLDINEKQSQNGRGVSAEAYGIKLS